MNIYEFRFSSCYLGGIVIVKGKDENDAYLNLLEVVKIDIPKFEDCRIEKIKRTMKVIYYDNGDY